MNLAQIALIAWIVIPVAWSFDNFIVGEASVGFLVCFLSGFTAIVLTAVVLVQAAL